MAVPLDRSRRLPKTEYFAEVCRKTGIALHHTVCDHAHTILGVGRGDDVPVAGPRPVATAYVVEKDGTIFEAFDPTAWAWQFGLPWRDDRRIPFEQRFIGIRLACDGGLINYRGGIYAYDQFRPPRRKSKKRSLKCVTPYRDYSWFDRFEPQQLEALARLVSALCDRFSIPRRYPERPFLCYGAELAAFEGVIGHAMVRVDTSDPAPDPRLWEALRTTAGLEPTPLAAPASANPLGGGALHQLLVANAFSVDRLAEAAGVAVLELVMELERRGVFLRLETPRKGGRTIKYDVVQGDRGQVAPLARALGGFKRVTERVLEA
jgi:hypothetical protein